MDDKATTTEQWIERYESSIWNTFGRRRLVLERGEGPRVWDIEGNEYLDFITGIAVNSLGHGHPAITEAIHAQADALVHCTNLYYIPAQIEWAELLLAHSFAGRVFFANSGAEANEGMIKAARRYASAHFLSERRTIITFCNSFHGRTLATLSATGQEKMHEGYDPLMPGFKMVEYNNAEALRFAVDKRVCAIMIEPIIGEGGVVPATQELMDTLGALREEHGLLLLFDEVQCGLGRAGENFAYQHYGVEPDIMTLAKPLGGGLAAGAVIANEKTAAVMGPGSHGSTMGGNPLAAAAGLAFCKVLFGEKLAERAKKLGGEMLASIKDWPKEIECVDSVRGMGLMLAVVMSGPGADVVERCEKKGLLVNCTAGNVVRMLPALNVSDADVAEALRILREALEESASEN